MAKRTKQRGINFYFLTKKMHRQDLELPALEIWSLINEIKQLDVIDKILDIKNDKFMYLDFSEKNTTDTVSLFFYYSIMFFIKVKRIISKIQR